MERMSGLDATFLYFETPNMHMHVLGVIVFDPATSSEPYSFERVKEVMSGRLHLVPPFRRKLAPVPFNMHHPVWVEDAELRPRLPHPPDRLSGPRRREGARGARR